jgi:hypothetical protein
MFANVLLKFLTFAESNENIMATERAGRPRRSPPPLLGRRRTGRPEDRRAAMKTLVRLARSADLAPRHAIEDAVGLALICVMIGVGFAATGLM